MKDELEEIKKQAEYCLNCKTKPCKKGCPLQNNIPDFIEKMKQKAFEEAFDILSETTIFEPICGRICPHKAQCEGQCVRGIKGESVKIGYLEKFIGDYALEKLELNSNNISNKGKKIAIVGSGPSGLAAAHYLSNKGYKVTIFEKHSKLGGLLRYGIPEFRLERKILDNWLNQYILNKNIHIMTNIELGKDITLEELKQKYDKIILAFGANVSHKMHIPGEEKENVIGGNELLEYRKFPSFYHKKVAIIGGGNVAMDTARTVKRLGAKEVSIVYRRDEKQMPAEKKEVEEAMQEGIKFLFQTNVIKILENKIECVKTKLVRIENEKRLYPINEENTNFLIDTDYVILAVGSKADKELITKLGLKTSNLGYISVDENYKTSDEQIYACGDLIGNNQTVAWAARSGLEVAKSIEESLENIR